MFAFHLQILITQHLVSLHIYSFGIHCICGALCGYAASLSVVKKP